jgi:anti-sigma factor (TIGR02949 family)
MAEHAHDHRVTCQEVVELVTEYLDGSLSPADAALFEEHLNFCDPCVVYVDEIRSTIATVGRIAEEDVPPDMREQLLAAFRDWRRA